MNEKRIQEVIEVEKQAQQLLADARRAAEELPAKAEVEARDILQRARDSARREANELLERSAQEDESAAVLSDARARMEEYDTQAEMNLEKAVDYVLQQVLGGS